MNTVAKYLIVGALCLIPLILRSQEITKINKPVNCLSLIFIFQVLARDYGEEPFFAGNDNNNRNKHIVTLNPKTGTWTMIEYEDNIGCIIGSGTKALVNIDLVLKNGVRL